MQNGRPFSQRIQRQLSGETSDKTAPTENSLSAVSRCVPDGIRPFARVFAIEFSAGGNPAAEDRPALGNVAGVPRADSLTGEASIRRTWGGRSNPSHCRSTVFASRRPDAGAEPW